jgi:glycosyltransferase involved in cell wall biosynthesis
VVFVGADAKYMVAFRSQLFRNFQERGYKVVVIATPLPGFDPASLEAMGVEFVPWGLKKACLNPLGELEPILNLWRALRRLQPKIVFAHTIKPVIYTMITAALAGVARRVAMIPGLGYSFTGVVGLKRRMIATAAWAGYRVALSFAHMVIFHNADDRAELRAVGALPKSTPSGLVNGSGVDMARFAAAPLPEGPTTFLLVARLLKDKGVYEFIEAARTVKAQLPQTRFVVVGSADSNPTAIPADVVRAWVAEGLIEAPGHLPDPRTAYADCHVFVLPSYREGTPRTNLEAMATGRAVITTDVPGCRETVVDGLNGLLAPARDAAALAAAMLSLAQDRDRVRRMGEAGRRLCSEKYELGAVARATTSLMISDPLTPWTPVVVGAEPDAGLPAPAPTAITLAAE